MLNSESSAVLMSTSQAYERANPMKGYKCVHAKTELDALPAERRGLR